LAPLRTASLASNPFAEGVIAPSGKPTTAIGKTLEPCRRLAQYLIFEAFTQTDANPNPDEHCLGLLQFLKHQFE